MAAVVYTAMVASATVALASALALERGAVRPVFSSIALLCALACARGGGENRRERPPPLVAVARISVRDVEETIRAPVDLRPLLQADVGAKTLGYLDAVLVDRGDPVKKGQLLALVRPSDLPDQLAAARSAAVQAEAAVALARANQERARALAPAGRVSKQELQQAETALASAEAMRSVARSQVGAIAIRLGETRITSPLDGVVSARRLDPGALVGPTSGSTGPILTVDQIDVLRLFISVNEGDVHRLKLGQPAHVEIDALPGRRYEGHVVRLAPSLDPATRTLDAEVQLPNRGGELRAGMYGRAAIVTGVHPGALTAPVGAVQISNGRNFVYVLNGDKVSRREVTLGVDGEQWLEIVSGVQPQDELVIAGLEGLSDGTAVRPARNVDPFGGAAASEVKQPQTRQE
jgi:RND family efflux transporter MFP subunit